MDLSAVHLTVITCVWFGSLVVEWQAAPHAPLRLCFPLPSLAGAPPALTHVLLQPVPAMPALRPDPAGQQLQ